MSPIETITETIKKEKSTGITLRELQRDARKGCTLQELQKDARKGYIADKGKIIRIMERVAEMSLEKILDCVWDKQIIEDAKLVAGCLYEEHGLADWANDDNIKSLTYTELFCLLDNSTEIICESRTFHDLGFDWLFDLLQQAKKQNFVLEQYFSIGINELFEYLRMRHLGKDRDAVNAHETYQKIITASGLESNMSIEKALEKIKSHKQVAWNPWQSWESYEKQIREMYEVRNILLIDCFRLAYPERFQLETIIHNLQARAI